MKVLGLSCDMREVFIRDDENKELYALISNIWNKY